LENRVIGWSKVTTSVSGSINSVLLLMESVPSTVVSSDAGAYLALIALGNEGVPE